VDAHGEGGKSGTEAAVMTNEERARDFWRRWRALPIADCSDLDSTRLLADLLDAREAEVRAEERERCARVCDEYAADCRYDANAQEAGARACARRIRDGEMPMSGKRRGWL